MNNYSFEIENTVYTVSARDGHTVLKSDGPHWAAQDTNGGWAIFKGEHFRMMLPAMAPESAAAKLLNLDRAHRDLMNSLGITPA